MKDLLNEARGKFCNKDDLESVILVEKDINSINKGVGL